MSGIYGSLRHYSPSLLEQKKNQLQYRAPIKILDTNANGITVVLDGALYNQTGEDALVDLYRKHGVACLNYLNGDFAFVLYDPQSQQLFGAVDRIGSKPLYYSLKDGFEFCSHLLPLCIGNNYSVDPYARQCFFAMQYVPAPYSILSEVKKMEAGGYFVYNISDGTIKTDSYWDLYDNTSHFSSPTSFEEAVSQSESLLADAVKMRMSSEPNPAIFLSGGIDSSLVAVYGLSNNSHCKAYSVSFQESSRDESYYSSKVAEHLGVEYHKLVFTWQDALQDSIAAC